MVAKAFSAARSVSPTLSSRLTVRTAASTWVLSVRWRPRALSRPRSRNCASIASSRPCSSLPAIRRARNSHRTEKSNPGSVSSRPSAYFQSIRPRTASAACRSLSPSVNCSTVTRARRHGECAGWPPVWLGVTAENQAEADHRLRILLRIPAVVHFASVEPQLAPVDLRRYLAAGLDWVIVGGESGKSCRPFDVDGVRGLRDQCQAAGAAFFMKQLGGHPRKRCRVEDLPADLRIRQWPRVNSVFDVAAN